MRGHVDHVVIWVTDARRAIDFFEKVVGLEGVRVEDFLAGKVPFASVRLSEDTLLDLDARDDGRAAQRGRHKISPVVATSAGHRVHHVCLAMARAEYDALRERIEAHGGKTLPMREQFGRAASRPRRCILDPDGNVFEARYY